MRQTTAVLLFGPIGITVVWLIVSYGWALLMQGRGGRWDRACR